MKTSLAKEKPQDWHPADVKAALEKLGCTLRQLSIEHGYAGGIVQKALTHAYPSCETIIADALGVTPQTIWPSRYNMDGTPKRLRKFANTVRRKCTTGNGVGKVEITEGI